MRRSPSQILPLLTPPPPSQSPLKIPQPSVNASSRYQKLEQLLAEGKWKEADEETKRVMLAVAKVKKSDFESEENWLKYTSLDCESIDNFPCEDLRSIDWLWVKYSNGKFGFSVQKRIYQGLGGTEEFDYKIWDAFADRVGWINGKIYQGFLYHSDVSFYNIKTAPEGRLPHLVVGGYHCPRGLVCSLASRLVDCKI